MRRKSFKPRKIEMDRPLPIVEVNGANGGHHRGSKKGQNILRK
jgi:hypothetical protein